MYFNFSPQTGYFSLDLETIGNDELLLLCSSSEKVPKRPLRPEEIINLPFVAAERHSSRRAIEDAALREFGIVSRNIILEFGNSEAMIRAIQTGIGYAFLFKSSIEDQLFMKRLKIVKVEKMKIEVPIFLIKSRNKYFSPFRRFRFMITFALIHSKSKAVVEGK